MSYNPNMKVTYEDLKDSSDDEDFLDLNKQVLEKLAVHTLIDAMTGQADYQTKVGAAKLVLDALGKSKPPAQPPQTNVQVNQFFPHMREALEGMSGVLKALPQGGSDVG